MITDRAYSLECQRVQFTQPSRAGLCLYRPPGFAPM